jgi:hypothetical protein
MIAGASQCWAGYSLDDCAREYNQNKKHFCLAVATLNANECEKIKSFEMRSTCITTVKDNTRAVTWKIHPLTDKNTNLR